MMGGKFLSRWSCRLSVLQRWFGLRISRVLLVAIALCSSLSLASEVRHGTESTNVSGQGGLDTFRAKLVKVSGDKGFGLKLYQRSQEYNLPSEGDKLKASTATYSVVSGVIDGSPASRGGLQVGDQILEVNGVNLAKRGLDQILELLRGGGDVCELLVWRRAPLHAMSPRGDPPSRVVSVVAYNRPDYFRRTLSHLARCTGIQDYTVMFFIEPVDSEVIALARNFTAAHRSVVHVNPVQFGFPHNIRQAVEVGFTQGDFVILLEDDILLSEDALKYFEWAQIAYARDPDVFTVTAYGDIGHNPDGEDLPASDRYAVARRSHFTPWAWGTWIDRFGGIAHVYTGWDAQMNFEFQHANKGPNYQKYGAGLRGSRFEAFPLVSRANNIGMEGGIHERFFSAEKMKAMQFLFKSISRSPWSLDEPAFNHASNERLQEICENCASLGCGQDTTRGLCTRMKDEATSPQQGGTQNGEL